MKLFRVSTLFGSAIVMAGISATAMGAGFALQEQSVKGLGNAFAGTAATADDASTIFHNPAGMTYLPGTTFTGGFHVVVPQAQFTNTGSATTPAPPLPAIMLPTTLSGSDGETDPRGLVPNGYYSHQMSDQLWLGIGMNAPFGLATEYDRTWVGRYHAIKSDIATININPSAAFKVNDQLSVGVGVNVQYIDVELTNAIDFGTLDELGFFSGVPGTPGLGFTVPQGTDGLAALNAGDDFSFGYNLGLIYQMSEATRFGLSYRSKVDHDLEGDATFELPRAAISSSGGFVKTGATAAVELPASLNVGIFHQLNEKVSVMGGATWTDWDAIQTIVIGFANPVQGAILAANSFGDGNTTQELDLAFDDTISYAVGLNYVMDEEVTLRMGVQFDESPVTSAATRTARLPDADRIWIGLGFTYRTSDSFAVDVGYAHLFVDDASITQTETTSGHTLIGNYDGSADIVSFSINMGFD